MLIDCDTCAVRGPACGDCVVMVLLAGPPVTAGDVTDPMELDAAEQAAIAVLADSGLVPPLRLVPGTGHEGVTSLTDGAGPEPGTERQARRNHSA